MMAGPQHLPCPWPRAAGSHRICAAAILMGGETEALEGEGTPTAGGEQGSGAPSRVQTGLGGACTGAGAKSSPLQ